MNLGDVITQGGRGLLMNILETESLCICIHYACFMLGHKYFGFHTNGKEEDGGQRERVESFFSEC